LSGVALKRSRIPRVGKITNQNSKPWKNSPAAFPSLGKISQEILVARRAPSKPWKKIGETFQGLEKTAFCLSNPWKSECAA
jgi:hypothetical protein